ncbi:MAG: tetratricopeptide repeat protein [Elusimicrobia bacterium]|nr:tetratricopeptide repeat protein [Elusimicrobiota bacterium]
MAQRPARLILGALSTACVLAALILTTPSGLPPPFLTNPGHMEPESGEGLLHGVEDNKIEVSYTMPLASISAAFCFGHLGPGLIALAWRAAIAALFVLSFALGLAVAGWSAALAAPALMVPFTPTLLRDPINLFYALLVLVVAGSLVARARAPSGAQDARLGLAIGFSLLYRSPLVLFPLALTAFEWLTAPRRARPGWRSLLLLCLIPAAMLLPWIRMNRIAHGGFFPLERGRTDILLLGSITHVQKWEAESSHVALDPDELERAGGIYRWWAREVLRRPSSYLDSCLGRVRFIVSFHPFLFLAALSALWLGRRRAQTRVLGFLIFYLISVHSAIAIGEAYLVPLWPLLAALAGSLPAEARRRGAPRADPSADSVSSKIFAGCLALIAPFCLFALWTVMTYGTVAERRSPRSEQAWQEALAEAPEEPWIILQDGKRKLARGDLQGAGACFARAAALRPEDENIRFHRAWALALQGEPDTLMRFELPLSSLVLRESLSFLKASICLGAGLRAEARDHIAAGLEVMGIPLRSGARTDEPAWAPDDAGGRAPFVLSAVREILRPMPRGDGLRLLGEIAGMADARYIADVWLELAQAHADAGDGNQALRDLDAVKGLDLKPDELRRLVRVYCRLGRYRAARALIAGLSTRNPVAARLWLDLAEAALVSRRRDIGLPSLRIAADLAAEPELRRQAALLFARAGESRRALAILEPLTLRQPSDARLWLQLASLSLAAGQRDSALRSLDKAARLADRPALLHESALLFNRAGDGRRAMAILEALSREQPSDPRIWLDLASISLDLGLRDQGARALENSARLASEPDLQRESALLFRKAGNARRALAILQPLARQAPSDARLWLDLAAVSLEIGERDSAMRSLDHAAKLAAEPDILYQSALLFSKAGDRGRALAILRSLARAQPSNATVWVDMASLATSREESLRDLAQARKLKTDFDDRRRIALLYQDLRDYRTALGLLERLAQEHREDASLRADRGLCEYLNGRVAEAIADLETALGLDRRLVSAHVTLASIYAAQGRYDQALKVYDRALSLDLSADPALRRRLIDTREETLSKAREIR